MPGLKMFADINAKRGLEQMSFAQLSELGYDLITMHFTMKAAMAGMLEAGRANLAEMGNTYSNEMMPDEYPGHSGMAFFAAQELLDLETEFTGRAQTFNDPRAFTPPDPPSGSHPPPARVPPRASGAVRRCGRTIFGGDAPGCRRESPNDIR
ncbi:hypothetical protein HR12_43400, partial [Microbacterium sp. SUBG005]